MICAWLPYHAASPAISKQARAIHSRYMSSPLEDCDVGGGNFVVVELTLLLEQTATAPQVRGLWRAAKLCQQDRGPHNADAVVMKLPEMRGGHNACPSVGRTQRHRSCATDPCSSPTPRVHLLQRRHAPIWESHAVHRLHD